MPLLLDILDLAEEDWKASRLEKEKKLMKKTMYFMIIGFMLLLRGKEVPLTNLQGLLQYWGAGKGTTILELEKHIMITLWGQFEG